MSPNRGTELMAFDGSAIDQLLTGAVEKGTYEGVVAAREQGDDPPARRVAQAQFSAPNKTTTLTVRATRPIFATPGHRCRRAGPMASPRNTFAAPSTSTAKALGNQSARIDLTQTRATYRTYGDFSRDR